jgi:hypothetical protein
MMRMMWWFIILGTSGAVAICAAVAIFLRVRGNMFGSKAASPEMSEDVSEAAASQDLSRGKQEDS